MIKLPDALVHTLTDVRREFRVLKKIYRRRSDMHKLRTDTTGTLIEQFFRVMIKEKRISVPEAKTRVSISILESLFQQLQQKPKAGEAYTRAEDIRLACKKTKNCHCNDDRHSVRFDGMSSRDELVTRLMGKPDQDASEWIRLYSLSLQSVDDISNYTGNLLDSPDLRIEYSEFFGTRNRLAHSLTSKQVNVTRYFYLTELLFKEVEKTNP